MWSPTVGNFTTTELAIVPPRSTFRFDVDGTPVASPGRTETKPAAPASTAVTVNDTAVAPNGTNEPTTVTRCSTPSTNETKPRSLRVSTTRCGVTGTYELANDEPPVARTTASPPAPTTDATTTPAINPRTPSKRPTITNSNQVNSQAFRPEVLEKLLYNLIKLPSGGLSRPISLRWELRRHASATR